MQEYEDRVLSAERKRDEALEKVSEDKMNISKSMSLSLR